MPLTSFALRRPLLGLASLLGTIACVPTLALSLAGQQPAGPPQPPANSPRRADPSLHALVGATVHASPTQTFDKADVIIRGSTIEKVVVSGEAPPAGATIWDCSGLHIYAGFIEPYAEVDAPAPDRAKASAHWSNRVMPQRRALDGAGLDTGTTRALRNLGFTTAAIAPRGGIFRGRASVVPLSDADPEASNPRPPVYAEDAYSLLAFDIGGGFGGGGGGGGGGASDNSRWDGYPGSLMGSIALIRQTFFDAQHRRASIEKSLENEVPNALDFISPGSSAPARLVFSVDDELDALRAIKIADEFNRPAILLGSGFEFRRLDALAASSIKGQPIIVPLNFPRKPNVAGISEAESVELRDLMTWEQAPTNPRRLAAAGFPVVLTTAKLRDRGQFRENLRSAIRHGFEEKSALAALTTAPAQLFGLERELGTLEMNKRAHLIVADGPIFAKKTKIRDVWVDGKRHEINAAPISLEGTYSVTIDPPPAAPGTLSMVIDKDGNVTIKKQPAAPAPGAEAPAEPPAQPAPPAEPEVPKNDGAASNPDATKPDDAKPADAKPAEGGRSGGAARKPREQTSKARNVVIQANRLSFIFDHEPFGAPGTFAVSGVVDPASKPETRVISGDGRRSDGAPYRWSATRTGPAEAPKNPTLGRYRVTAPAPANPDETATITIDEKSVTVERGGKSAAATDVKVEGDDISYALDMTPFGGTGIAKITLKRSPPPPGTTGQPDRLTGTITLPGEADAPAPPTPTHPIEAVKTTDEDDEPKPDAPEKLPGYPFGPCARETLPPQGDIVFEHATIWTCTPESTGPLTDASIRIKDGTIVWIADSTQAGAYKLDPTTRVINAKGKHISPGIIDAHSHTGISRGVNEGGQAVTAEVRIQDVTNPDAINWYRQLAGGVTAVSNLHGSANAIGGQSQTNKIRWGVTHPDQMHFETAIPGIKFALGENPKWGNSSEGRGWRYPQTRMGVEALIRDRFTAAKEYAAARAGPNPPARDLELDALAEVLAGTRLVHCHSYRQDEILMLGRMAAEFGFKIGTYQHILEGYKVAEILRAHSGGASGFADWWAYKVEVQDAIPQAFPIMFEQGVLVSLNSDSDELARRMNVEAGKAVKYSGGSVSHAEALRWVTANPAKQLRVDGRTGSLASGKDADLVIWSGQPTSSLSRCEATYVDGRELYSLSSDAALRERDGTERQRLIQKLLTENKRRPVGTDAGTGDGPGGPGGRPRRPRPPQGDEAFDEDDMSGTTTSGRTSLLTRMADSAVEARRKHFLELIRRGINPADHRSGDCGCQQFGW